MPRRTLSTPRSVPGAGDRAWFLNLDDARRNMEDRRVEYKDLRPHSAVAYRPPMALLPEALDPSEATAEPGPLI